MRSSLAVMVALAGLFVVSNAVAGDPAPAPAPAPAAAPSTRVAKAETAMVETLQMVRAGNVDEWIGKWCDPNTCNGKYAIEQYKTYQLKSVANFGGECLWGDAKDHIQIVRWKDDPETTEEPTFYIKCGERLPVPITVRYDGDRVWVTKMSI
jgi:hypothetical protein